MDLIKPFNILFNDIIKNMAVLSPQEAYKTIFRFTVELAKTAATIDAGVARYKKSLDDYAESLAKDIHTIEGLAEQHKKTEALLLKGAKMAREVLEHAPKDSKVRAEFYARIDELEDTIRQRRILHEKETMAIKKEDFERQRLRISAEKQYKEYLEEQRQCMELMQRTHAERDRLIAKHPEVLQASLQ